MSGMMNQSFMIMLSRAMLFRVRLPRLTALLSSSLKILS